MKCSGCKLPANDHKFGPVGSYCEAPDLSKQVDDKKKSLLSHMKTVPEHIVMDHDIEKSGVDWVDGDDDVERKLLNYKNVYKIFRSEKIPSGRDPLSRICVNKSR